MMAFMAALEADLRALSAEARRRHPALKDAAEHAILKLRSSSDAKEIAQNDIVRIFLMACEVKSVKLSVIGLSCIQKLLSNDAVLSYSLGDVVSMLKNHAEIADEAVQLKTLQTVLIIFQSFLHHENEENLSKALGICLRLLENTRSSDSVHNTAAATFRQAVALTFDNIATILKNQRSHSSTAIDDVGRHLTRSTLLENVHDPGLSKPSEGNLSISGKLGVRLLEDLTALASGGSAIWLPVHSLQRTFSLDIVDFILSNYVAVFRSLITYEQVLRHQICSLLMNSLRTNVELEGEAGEPTFRRLVLKTVAHVIKLYSSSLVTECEVFLNVLVKATALDMSLWHRILVLEVLRGFCVDAPALRILYQTFDMDPRNTNVVENMVKAFARVVSTVQVHDSADESLAAVAGMFNSKAKGIEWSLENDAPNAAVVVASEAHAIALAIEGLLGVVFTIAALTDEAVEAGELESPKFSTILPREPTGKTTTLCLAMVESMWLIILDSLSLVLTRSRGEAIMLEILKGYQAFTQACGILRAVEPLNSFLASLCKFTICVPGESEKRSQSSPASKKSELLVDQKEGVVLTPKNVQALRTLFNVAHRLHNVLGESWVLVLETVASLDRAIHSPHASTQEVSASVPRFARETSGQYTDFNILSSLDSQLFESSALMDVAAVKALLSALHMLSNQSISANSGSLGQNSTLQLSNMLFSVERTILILENNLPRVESLWDQVVGHYLELNKNPNLQIRSVALDALDRSVCAVLGSPKFQSATFHLRQHGAMIVEESGSSAFEHSIISPIRHLYASCHALDVRSGCLKILLHVLERHAEKLYFSWSEILEMLRSAANASEKDLIPLGFQSVRVIVNDELSTIPIHYLETCIDVTGAYAEQQADLNISLTAIGLLWTSSDFIAKGLHDEAFGGMDTGMRNNMISDAFYHDLENAQEESAKNPTGEAPVEFFFSKSIDSNKLLLSVFNVFRKLGADERPEVRNAVIRTLFQTLGSHGQRLSRKMWEDCLWTYVFPILDSVRHLAATSSRDEWHGKELGTRRGKAVHMLIHHSRNTAQKQWDETLVLVLNGITRLLRSFFTFLQTLENFSAGWEKLLLFVKDSISNGSKEVAFAAISCLQTTVISNCPKGNISVPQLKSVLDVYELVLQRSPSYTGNATHKVTQEILNGLASLFVEARLMFNSDMYTQLLVILQLAIQRSIVSTEGIEADFVNIQSVHRTIYEVIPLLCPEDHLSSMWPQLLGKLLSFLPGSCFLIGEENDDTHFTGKRFHSEGLRSNSSDVDLITQNQVENDFLNRNVFGEKLIPVLVEIFLRAPDTERETALSEFLHSLGRCMGTRRDNPIGRLWRLAAEGFNRIILDIVTRGKSEEIEQTKPTPSRNRLWKEIADIYDTFLVGSCGRAIASGTLSAETLSAGESLEISILNILGDQILKAKLDSPHDSLERLVSVLDHCASRTGSLPLETISLLPPHCSRFSLSCLLKLFSLSSCSMEDSWHYTRIEISRISIGFLMKRCKIIVDQYLKDESDLGERTLPMVRTEELLHVLEELARMTVHPEVESALLIPQNLREFRTNERGFGLRSHLLLLFPSFCELVSSREPKVRELVQVLLRLVASELGLQKLRT